MGVPGCLAFPIIIPCQREPSESSSSSPHPQRHPQPPPSLPEAGGRARAPRGHHPNSYNQQPRQDFKLTQLSCKGKKTQNENKLTCLHRSCCSNTQPRTRTSWRMPWRGWETPPGRAGWGRARPCPLPGARMCPRPSDLIIPKPSLGADSVPQLSLSFLFFFFSNVINIKFIACQNSASLI